MKKFFLTLSLATQAFFSAPQQGTAQQELAKVITLGHNDQGEKITKLGDLHQILSLDSIPTTKDELIASFVKQLDPGAYLSFLGSIQTMIVRTVEKRPEEITLVLNESDVNNLIEALTDESRTWSKKDIVFFYQKFGILLSNGNIPIDVLIMIGRRKHHAPQSTREIVDTKYYPKMETKNGEKLVSN